MMKSFWKRVLSNSLLLLGARVTAKVATIAVMIVIARRLGVAQFGVYSGIIALTALTGLVSDFGLVLPTIRSVSTKAGAAVAVVSESVTARVVWGAMALVGVGVFGALFGFPQGIVLLFGLSSVMEVTSAVLIRTFEAVQDMKTVTMFTIVERMTFCTLVVTGVYLRDSIDMVGIAYGVSYVVTLFFALFLFQRRFGRLRIRLSRAALRAHTMLGLPFFITGIASAAYYKADTLLLTVFRTNAEVGVYNAALRVFDAQIFIPLAIMATIFPTLSLMHTNKDEGFFSVLQRSMGIFAGVGLTISVAVFIGATMIIRSVFSTAFDDAVSALHILAPTMLFYFLYFYFSYCLVAINREVVFTAVMTFVALANIAVNLAVVPSYGFVGAAWVRLCSEGIMALLLGIFLAIELRRKRAAFAPSPLHEAAA